jgi:hypothetical protein
MRTYRKLLTLEALSGVADISVRYLREEIRDGGLLAIRIGLREYRVTYEDARAYLSSRVSDDRLELLQVISPVIIPRAHVALKCADVAAFLDVSRQHVRNMLRSGDWGGLVLMSTIRISHSRLADFLSTHRTG